MTKQSFIRGLRFVSFAALFFFVFLIEPGSSANAQSLIVALGDSDTNYPSGLSLRGTYPGQLETLLKDKGHNVKVNNEGKPGQTAKEALSRLDRTVPAGTAVVLVQFGTSDIKVNESPAQIRATLSTMIEKLKAQGAKVIVVAGRPPAPDRVPRGYDLDGYRAMFSSLAREHLVGYHNFLDGVPPLAQDRDRKFYFSDAHLNTAGNAIVAEKLLPKVEALLGQ